jgi:hypothetical protein
MPILGASASGAKSVPVAPTIGTATNVGTSRAYNNGAATVTFTAPNSKLPISSYTVTSSPGSYTGTGSSSPITVAGLQSNTAYTFTVTATSAIGTSAASSASNSITATTVPQAPTIGSATAGNASATVAYTAGANGGAAVSTFTATASPGGATGTGASPITVSGLSNGTAYTFTVTATNANGTSAASAASNSVTPAYAVGGTGPGGGIIFYDAGSTLSWGRYMEVASPASSPAWDINLATEWSIISKHGVYAGTAYSTAIGTGLGNTNIMVAQNGTAGYAGTSARYYYGGGRTDWFLPSMGELQQIYIQRASIGGYNTGLHWSSTEVDASVPYAAQARFFTSGNADNSAKHAPYRIRAVRYF